MDELMQDKEKTKIQKYLKNQGRYDFVKEADNMSVGDLNKKMLDLAKYNEEIENTMKVDKELKAVKDKKTELERPYKHDKKMNQTYRRYVALILEERGELGAQK